MHVITMPQATTRNDSQRLGLTFFKMMLEGTSMACQSCMLQLCPAEQGSLTEYDVGDEEDSTGDVVLIANEPEVSVHALNLCVSDIASINVGKKIKNAHNGDQANIDLHSNGLSVS